MKVRLGIKENICLGGDDLFNFLKFAPIVEDCNLTTHVRLVYLLTFPHVLTFIQNFKKCPEVL